MNNFKLLAAVALCIAYIAGIATGWAGYTLVGAAAPAPDRNGSWLSHTLGLTAEQEAQMEAIWSREAPETPGDDSRTTMRMLYDERNAAVRALMTEAQQREMDRIFEEFEAKKAAHSEARRQRHEEAVAKTMAILTPEQQEQYQEVLSKFGRRGSKGGHGPAPGGWPSKPRD